MSKFQGKDNRRANRHTDLDKNVSSKGEDFLFQLLEESKTDPFLLILDGVQDPQNLGACLRTADAAGVKAVVIPKDRSAGLSDSVRNVACGAAERLPLIQVTNLVRIMGQLKDLGVWLVGTGDSANKSIYEIDLRGPIGLVMGSEGKGLRRLTAETCDFLACIPMYGSVESLNVSVATGVALFEAVRQRKIMI